MSTDFRALSTEEWLPVVGHEGCYSVSSLGNVRSDERLVPNGTARQTVRERLLRQRKNLKGYLCVDLARYGKKRTARVHKLVAEAFIGLPPVGLCVLHGPLGKECNVVSNLYYGTLTQNNGPDRVRDGTDNRGTRNGNAKLSPDSIKAIRDSKETHAALARLFNVSSTTIYQIRLRKRWSHVC
jgi:hypothetical protein